MTQVFKFPPPEHHRFYGGTKDVDETKIRCPLLRQVAEREFHLAEIGGEYYRLHYNHDGLFLFDLPSGEKRCNAVEVHDGMVHDGHVVKILRYHDDKWRP
jgi:hypothetical protein